MRCPIREHDHELTLIKTHVQDGTGNKCFRIECPTSTRRWFVPEGKEPAKCFEMAKPKWGWKN